MARKKERSKPFLNLRESFMNRLIANRAAVTTIVSAVALIEPTLFTIVDSVSAVFKTVGAVVETLAAPFQSAIFLG